MNGEQKPLGGPSPQSDTRDNILNSLNISIYVSDLATNEILYANAFLQKRYRGQSLEGRICWEALENRASRCDSCPIPYLLKHPGQEYQRERYNSSHHKIHDCIITWENGKLAHLRYVIDIIRDTPQNRNSNFS